MTSRQLEASDKRKGRGQGTSSWSVSPFDSFATRKFIDWIQQEATAISNVLNWKWFEGVLDLLSAKWLFKDPAVGHSVNTNMHI